MVFHTLHGKSLPVFLLDFIYFIFNFYLFGCIRSLLWQSISSLPHLWSFIAGCRLSSCGAWALFRLSFSAACGIVPWPGIEPISPILQGRFSGKESTCHCRRHRKGGLDPPVQEDPLEEEMAIIALQFSGLKNPLDREAGGLQAMGSPRVGNNWVTEHAHTFLTTREVPAPFESTLLVDLPPIKFKLQPQTFSAHTFPFLPLPSFFLLLLLPHLFPLQMSSSLPRLPLQRLIPKWSPSPQALSLKPRPPCPVSSPLFELLITSLSLEDSPTELISSPLNLCLL